MLKMNIFLKFIISLSVIIIQIGNILAQSQVQNSNGKKIEIVNSDSLTFDKSRGSDVKLLYGHVIFRQDNVLMYCDSAKFYSESNLFDAYSNIHILQGDTVEVWGDSLNYNGESKLAQLRGSVKMRDRKMVLTTKKFDYDMNASMGKYFGGGRIVDEDNILTSKLGIYYSNKKELFFKDQVVLHNKEYDVLTDTLKYNTITDMSYFFGPTHMVNKDSHVFTKKGWYNSKTDVCQLEKNSKVEDKEKRIYGDSIYYDKKHKFGRVSSNVVIRDTAQHITVTGKYAYFTEKPEYYLVRDSVVMIKEFEGDTLFLHSDTLVGFTIDTVKDNRIIKAYSHVRFFKSDIQGKCDSLVYKTKDSLISMNKIPVLWSDKSQITAKLITIHMKNDEVDHANIDDMAFIISQEDDTVNFNQVKGAKMIAYFKNRKFSKLDVLKNGETIYFMRDEKTLSGINKAICENLTVIFKNEEVNEVVFRKKPSGTMYPPNKVTEKETRLEDFKWQSVVRPKNKNDLFRWVE